MHYHGRTEGAEMEPVPILGVLKAEKEDQLADFSTRRMEKKDKLYRQRRQKEKQLWRETSE